MAGSVIFFSCICGRLQCVLCIYCRVFRAVALAKVFGIRIFFFASLLTSLILEGIHSCGERDGEEYRHRCGWRISGSNFGVDGNGVECDF